MFRKKLILEKKNNSMIKNKPEYKIEHEKFKDEIFRHDRDLVNLKQEIALLKERIKLGSFYKEGYS